MFLDLLRVIRKGPVVKSVVDDAIDLCSAVVNLRDSIEEARLRAEEASDERGKKLHTTKALQYLRRYFELIVFQAYLHSTEPDTLQSYENENIETFVKNRPGTQHCLIHLCPLTNCSLFQSLKLSRRNWMTDSMH